MRRIEATAFCLLAYIKVPVALVDKVYLQVRTAFYISPSPLINKVFL